MLSVSLLALSDVLFPLYLAFAFLPGTLTTPVTPTSSHHLHKRDVQLLNQCAPPGWEFIASFCIPNSPPDRQAYRIACEHPDRLHRSKIVNGRCPANSVCVDGPPPPHRSGMIWQIPWGTAYCLGYESIARLAVLGLGHSAAAASRHHTIHTSSIASSATNGDEIPLPTGSIASKEYCPENEVCVDGPASSEGPWGLDQGDCGTAQCPDHDTFLAQRTDVPDGVRLASEEHNTRGPNHTTGSVTMSTALSWRNSLMRRDRTSSTLDSAPSFGSLPTSEPSTSATSSAIATLSPSFSTANNLHPGTHLKAATGTNPSTSSSLRALRPRSNNRLTKRTMNLLNECPPPHTGWEFIFSVCLPRAGRHQSYVIYCRHPPTGAELVGQYVLLSDECAATEVCVQGPHGADLPAQDHPWAHTAYCLGYENIVSLANHRLHHIRNSRSGIDGSNPASAPASHLPEEAIPTSRALVRRANTMVLVSPAGWIRHCGPTHPGWTFIISYCHPIPYARSAYRKVCAFLSSDQVGDPSVRYVAFDGECDDDLTCLDGAGPLPPPANVMSRFAPPYLAWGIARCLSWEDFVVLAPNGTAGERERSAGFGGGGDS